MSKPTNQTAVTVANPEQLLARFERERADLIERRAALAEKRRSVAFDAHAGDGSASKLLDGLHREAAELESRITGLDDTVAEARRRLQQAREAEARAADRQQALALRQVLDEFTDTARRLDQALGLVSEFGNRLGELQVQMHQLGAPVPSAAQLQSLGERCLVSACGATPWRRAFPVLAPSERRSFSALIDIWRATNEKHLAARLSEQTNKTEAA